jgi:hypothetical protein
MMLLPRICKQRQRDESDGGECNEEVEFDDDVSMLSKGK